MISFKLIIGFLFGLLITAIAVLGVIAYQNSRASNETSYWVKHTHEVLDKADEISSLYKDIQLESSGLLISGDLSFMMPYRKAREVIISQVDNLRSLTRDNTGQQARIDILEAQLNDLMVFSDSALLSYNRAYSVQKILGRVRSNKVFRTRIREVINGIKDEENRLLVIREKANKESIAAFEKTFFMMLSGIIVLLVTTFLSIRYNFNRRMRMQQKLKNANELFVKLFTESPVGLVISHCDNGVIVDCNKTYSELINYDRTDIIGKTAGMLKIWDNDEQRKKIIVDARVIGIVRDIEVQLTPHDKEPIWVSVSTQVIQIQDRQCLLSAIVDTTVHKRADEEVKKALATEVALNKMKSNFVTLASHEFRTPLTTILSSTFLLENYATGENHGKLAKHIARIKLSVNMLTAILDDFLSLTKIEEHRVEPRLEQLNLKEYLQAVCQSLANLAKPGQRIVYTHSGECDVCSDPVLLGNIVTNLVTNAIKYSPPNTTISVASSVNESIRLSVKDSGIGIPAEDQKHLFERFFRASNAGAVQGTGLGLHIMKHYVSMLNGTVQVNSELDKGTEINVTLQKVSQEAEV
jgi:PAS domain S-box-containing protein